MVQVAVYLYKLIVTPFCSYTQKLNHHLSLHNSLPFSSYTASSASLWSSNSCEERTHKRYFFLNDENIAGSKTITHAKESVTLTTKPNPFFKLISLIRPYPLKNFSTSLSLAWGLKRPMKTRQPLIFICCNQKTTGLGKH